MDVAVISDPHLISPKDPNVGRREKRDKFVQAWPSFEHVIERVNDAGVEHLVILGDLVDYYSAVNRDFALDLLEGLEAEWHLTPGNHDFAVPVGDVTETDTEADRSHALEGWSNAGVDLSNRTLDIGDVRFVLVDSALSEVQPGTADWLTDVLDTDRICIVCTHVPLDTPPVVDAILEQEPDRNLDKYVQRGSPELFEDVLRNRVAAVFSGHLHFPAEADVEGTRQFIFPMCIRPVGDSYPDDGTVTIVPADDPTDFARSRIESPPSR